MIVIKPDVFFVTTQPLEKPQKLKESIVMEKHPDLKTMTAKEKDALIIGPIWGD